MKISLALFSCFVFTICSFAQSKKVTPKGNYFETTSKKYFETVIRPYKYEYTPLVNNNDDSAKKIGQIIFWRSEALYDAKSKKYWKPNIKYDIYRLSDWAFIKRFSDSIILVSNCDSINKGGDIKIVGNYVLLSTSPCVNCANLSNIDYCRNIVKRILQEVPD
ncbi:MAG: hypothetical protein ABIP69_06620, partial [Ferruginibacter sp.]